MTVAQLDYDGAKILMEADTDIERAFRLPACQKEPWTKDFVCSIPAGSVFYDIGANVGSYALIAASRGIPTVAIEPAAPNYGTLVRNVFLNDFDERITAFPVALGGVTGLAWLDLSDVRSGGASHVLGSNRRLFFHRHLVQVWRLDDLIRVFGLPAPTHLKIDVDGNGDVELAVLDGMTETLQAESLAGLILEMPLSHEPQIVEALGARGWTLGQRFDHRGDQKIANICYGSFVRVAAAKPEKPPRTKREKAGAAA